MRLTRALATALLCSAACGPAGAVVRAPVPLPPSLGLPGVTGPAPQVRLAWTSAHPLASPLQPLPGTLQAAPSASAAPFVSAAPIAREPRSQAEPLAEARAFAGLETLGFSRTPLEHSVARLNRIWHEAANRSDAVLPVFAPESAPAAEAAASARPAAPPLRADAPKARARRPEVPAGRWTRMRASVKEDFKSLRGGIGKLRRSLRPPTSRSALLENGRAFAAFFGEVKALGWKVIAAVLLYYLVRDTALYILLPYLLYNGFFGS